MTDKKLPDELLEAVSGGVLPAGWQNMVEMMYPQYRKIYPGITLDEAMVMIGKYIKDEKDLNDIRNYISKYFDPNTGVAL